jgi:hypothetical protein
MKFKNNKESNELFPDKFTGIIEYCDGISPIANTCVTYYLKGKLFNPNGQTIEHGNGTKYWFLNDLLHREDGPAIEYWTGEKCWWLDGHLFSEEEWKIEVGKLKTNKEIISK